MVHILLFVFGELLDSKKYSVSGLQHDIVILFFMLALLNLYLIILYIAFISKVCLGHHLVNYQPTGDEWNFTSLSFG